MATTEVSVLFKGKDQGVNATATKAGGALDKLGKKSEATGKKMQLSWKSVALGVAGAFLAIQQVKRAFTALVGAYQKQIEAETKLQAALKATGGQVGINFTEMKRMAEAMSNVTAIADENIIAAQGLLVTFTKIGKDVFPQALNAAADMSAMFGQDLQQSVIQLGTALNDPIAGVGRLRRIGISFSEEQKASIQQFVEQNDLMAAQGVILDELATEFGGVAVAMGQTATGALKKFQNAIGDTMEEIGEALATGTQPFVEAATKFLNDNKQKIGAIFRNIPEFAKVAFDTVVKIIKKALSFEFIGTVIVNFGKAFLENMITVAKAIPELLWTALTVLTAPVRTFDTWFGSVFEKVFADVANFFIDALNVIPFVEINRVQTKEIKDLGQVFDETIAEMDTTFGKFSSKLGDTMVSVGKNLLDATVATGKEFAPIIAEAGKEFDALFAADKKRQDELEAAQNEIQTRQAELNEQLKRYSEAWEDVLSVTEKFQDPLDKQEQELFEIQKRLMSYADIFERGTDDFNQWSLVLGQIDTQLLEIQKKRAGIESIVSRYANVFKNEVDALKAREASLKQEIDTLLKYQQLLKDKAQLYLKEGRSVEGLTAEIGEIDRVIDLMEGEISDVQKQMQGSSRRVLSTWDLLLGNVTDIFSNFAEEARQKYAEKAGVSVEDLTPEEAAAAEQAGVVGAAMGGLATVVLWLVDQLISLITSTEAWREVMGSFQETLSAVLEFAVVPLIDAIRPLLTVVIALVAVVGNLLVPIFKMLGMLIQAVMPVFIALGQIIIAAIKVVILLLPPVLTIVEILLTALAPVLRVVATLFDTLGVIIETLNPVFELLAFVVKVVATPIAVLGAIFEWVGNIIYNLGKFINNVINNIFNPDKWGQGMRRADLHNMIAEAVADVWAGPGVADFQSEIDFEDIPDFTQDFVFGDEGTQTQFEDLTPGIGAGGLYGGGGTSVTQVPDINIHQHFHAPVIGEGGKETICEYVVEAIQDYLGVGGTVTWLETTEGG